MYTCEYEIIFERFPIYSLFHICVSTQPLETCLPIVQNSKLKIYLCLLNTHPNIMLSFSKLRVTLPKTNTRCVTCVHKNHSSSNFLTCYLSVVRVVCKVHVNAMYELYECMHAMFVSACVCVLCMCCICYSCACVVHV